MTTKQTLTVEVMSLRARVAELEAQLGAERNAHRTTCAEFNEAQRQLLDAAHVPHHITPIITRFSKSDGTQWIKTRVGNRATSRQVLSNQEH